AKADNRRFNGRHKNPAFGLTLKLGGDISCSTGKFEQALTQYQEAITQFDIGFNNNDPEKVPEDFQGIFSYINLFDALIAKAGAWEQVKRPNHARCLQFALSSYKAAFALADYVGKTYESDEARLFLNRIKYSVHAKPIGLCLTLDSLTRNGSYLEEAYFFDQQNKASILSLNLQLNQFRQNGKDRALMDEQLDLKRQITRLNLAGEETDSFSQMKINAQLNDLQVRLAALQRTLNNDPKYAGLRPASNIPDIISLEQMIDGNTAIISYHMTEEELLVMLITKRGLNYYRQSIGREFHQALGKYLSSLRSIDPARRFDGDAVGKFLYTILIRPVKPFFRSATRLVIIPDDELNYIPFESLKDENDRYLLEDFSVQYQYSTALLKDSGHKSNLKGETLGFAPFDSNRIVQGYPGLPHSGEEIGGLRGMILTGDNATRQNFLRYVNRYPIVHLATHASVSNESPLRSTITFFPSHTDTSFQLYAGEIYNLRLDSTSLVILSACETGGGELIKGEGLMSLSRAFAYAGCTNIVTSLWKAEDKTTAFISRRLHFYLEQGLPVDMALRKAKLDLLSTRDIEPRFKSPNFWAHLVYIGTYQPRKSLEWPWIVGAIAAGLLLVGVLIKKRPRHAGTSSS
ncbi:MAG TPA: CHAT domain-containing protein, partial [Chitinophagaceae bacterium]